ncbi:MAG: CehA/McbA family metallohydrolase [Pseudomonadota bacterium]
MRVELRNAENKPVVADNPIPISTDCALAPLPDWLAQPAKTTLFNPFTGTHQHYVDGVGRYQLEAGTYQLRVFKGSEFRVVERELNVSAQEKEFHVELERWYAPDEPWVSADVHLHIGRLHPQQDTSVARWMAAEDLQIANLLQMGALTHFAAAPQYTFAEVADAGSLLVPGQEHPRTHLLGHSLSLGGTRAVDERSTYVDYNKTFAQVRSAGGISGFAHWGAGPAKNGIALNVHQGNVEILEVLGFGVLYADTWYELLNLGFRVAAVAGTDFPCLAGIPGRERTYLRMPQTPSREGMVEALRRGRSFVSNGPILKFTVDGYRIGDTIELSVLEDLRIHGELHFDPARDAVTLLELVYNGEVLRAWQINPNIGSFTFDDSFSLPTTGWVALRTKGSKVRETMPAPFPAWMAAGFSHWMSGASSAEVDGIMTSDERRRSYAHTSPIYIQSAQNPRMPADIDGWLERLDMLERMLTEHDYQGALIWDWLPYSDGVSEDHLRANAPALLQQIRAAREDFLQRAHAP